jgi:hypothetical protein
LRGHEEVGQSRGPHKDRQRAGERASKDFQKYLELNEKEISIQTCRKRYEAKENPTCRLHEPTIQEAVRVLLAEL